MERVIKNFKTFKETLRLTEYIDGYSGRSWKEYVIFYGLDGFAKTGKTSQREAYRYYRENHQQIDEKIPAISFLRQ